MSAAGTIHSSNFNKNLAFYMPLNTDVRELAVNNKGTATDVLFLGDGASMPAGTNRYIVTKNITLSGSYSVAFWYKPYTSGSLFRSVFNEAGASYGFYYDESVKKILYYDNNPNSYRYNNTALIENEWNLCVWVKNGSTAKWYLNGVLDSSNFTILDTIVVNRIGYTHASFTNNAAFKKIGVWHKALTDYEVSRYYNGGLGLDILKFEMPGTLNNSLTHAYDFEGNSNDLVGSSNGTDTNITYSAGKLGLAADFDFLSGSSMAFPSSLINFDNDFTLNLFIKCTQYIQNLVVFGKKDGSIFSAKGAYICNITNPLYLYWFVSDGTNQYFQNLTLTSTYDWTMITITRIDNIIYCYKDAMLLGSTDISTYGSINASADFSNGSGFKGSQDQLRIYNTGLNIAEIRRLFNNSKGLYA